MFIIWKRGKLGLGPTVKTDVFANGTKFEGVPLFNVHDLIEHSSDPLTFKNLLSKNFYQEFTNMCVLLVEL